MTRLWDTANGDVPNQFLSTRPSLPLEVSILFIARPTAKSMPTALGGTVGDTTSIGSTESHTAVCKRDHPYRTVHTGSRPPLFSRFHFPPLLSLSHRTGPIPTTA